MLQGTRLEWRKWGIGLLGLAAGMAPVAGQVDRQGEDHKTFYGNPFMEEKAVEAQGTAREPDKRLMLPQVFDEIFDTILPGQYKEGDWSLRLNPKLGDFFGDDYVRMLFGVRYSFSNYFDALTEFGTYFGNPFASGNGAGFYTYRLGVRYTWYNVWGSRANVAAGFNTEFPLSRPPYELSDGYARYHPFVSVSYRIDELPDWLFYISTSYEIVSDAPLHSPSPYIKPADRLFIRPGAIYYPGGRFRYSLELEYNTNAFDNRDLPAGLPEPEEFERINWILAYREVHELFAYPAITWFPSHKVRNGFIIPGNWDLSLRLRVPIVEETDRGFSVSLRLKWYYDYHRFLRGAIPRAFRRDGE